MCWDIFGLICDFLKYVCKKCKVCGFTGRVNSEEICGNCTDKVVSSESCGVCGHVMQDEHGLHCDLCQVWNHFKCEKIGHRLYKELQEENELPWVCMWTRRLRLCWTVWV